MGNCEGLSGTYSRGERIGNEGNGIKSTDQIPERKRQKEREDTKRLGTNSRERDRGTVRNSCQTKMTAMKGIS